MISKYDIKKAAESEKCWFTIDENEDVFDKESGKNIGTLDEILAFFRHKLHCDFEVIYSCHPTLETTYRCKDCGTVIFARDDEWYEENLCCPVCSDYQTGFEYWSGEEIKNDEKKQNTIDFLIKMQEEQEESYRRQKRRNGKYDWQISKWKIKIPNKAIYFELQCDNLFHTGLKGLRLHIDIGEKDGMGYIIKKFFTIPLSIGAAKTAYRVHKHLKEKEKENASAE